GATLKNDFIELRNNGSAPVSLASWSVQYISAAPGAATTWQVTNLAGSIAPGATYLIGEAAGAGGTADLPTPDATGAINLGGAASGGGDPVPGPLRIHDIQGAGWVSPVNGQAVVNVPGIVTAVRTSGSKGFWIQDPNPDANPATSEGLFVFTSSAPTVAVGDS